MNTFCFRKRMRVIEVSVKMTIHESKNGQFAI